MSHWLTELELDDAHYTVPPLLVRRGRADFTHDLLGWLSGERTWASVAEEHIQGGRFTQAARCVLALRGGSQVEAERLEHRLTTEFGAWRDEHAAHVSSQRTALLDLRVRGCDAEQIEDAEEALTDVERRLPPGGEDLVERLAALDETWQSELDDARALAGWALDECVEAVEARDREREARLEHLRTRGMELGVRGMTEPDPDRRNSAQRLVMALGDQLERRQLEKVQRVVDQLGELVEGRPVDLDWLDQTPSRAMAPIPAPHPRRPARSQAEAPPTIEKIGKPEGWQPAFDAPPGREWARDTLTALRQALGEWEQGISTDQRRRADGPRHALDGRLALLDGQAGDALAEFTRAYRWALNPPADLRLPDRWRDDCAAGLLIAVVHPGLSADERAILARPADLSRFFEREPALRLLARIEQAGLLPSLGLALCDLQEAAGDFVRRQLRPVLPRRPLAMAALAEALVHRTPHQPHTALRGLAEVLDLVDPRLSAECLERADALGRDTVDPAALDEALDRLQRALRDAAQVSLIAEITADALGDVIRWQHGHGGKPRFSTTLLSREVDLGRSARVVLLLSYTAGAEPLWNIETRLRLETGRQEIVGGDAFEHPPRLPRLRPGDSHEIHARLREPDPALTRARYVVAYHEARSEAGPPRIVESRGLRSAIQLDARPAPAEPPSNPYMVGRPLHEGIPGREAEVEKIRRSLIGRAQDNAVLVLGERRIGKTTLLNKLVADPLIRERYRTIVRVDLQNFGAREGATGLYIEHFIQALRDKLSEEPAPDRAAFLRSPHQAFKRYLRDLDERLTARGARLLFIVDELEKLLRAIEQVGNDLPDEVMGALRSVIQESRAISFILCGVTDVIRRHATQYQNRLFKLALDVDMPPLDDATCRALVCAPAVDVYEVTTAATHHIIETTGRHPYLLQSVCWELFDHMTTSGLQMATVDDVEHVLETRMLSKAPPFDYLLETVAAPDDLRVVKALSARQVHGHYVSIDEVRQHLERTMAGRAWSEERIERQLEDLARRAPSLIRRVPNNARKYRVEVFLFARRLRYIEDASTSLFGGLHR